MLNPFKTIVILGPTYSSYHDSSTPIVKSLFSWKKFTQPGYDIASSPWKILGPSIEVSFAGKTQQPCQEPIDLEVPTIYKVDF